LLESNLAATLVDAETIKKPQIHQAVDPEIVLFAVLIPSRVEKQPKADRTNLICDGLRNN